VRLYLIIVSTLFVVDQLTKFWITSHFSLYDSQVIIPGFFNLVYVTNKGAAFSMFASVESPFRHYFFVSINIIAFLGLSIAAYKMRMNHLLYRVSFALIAAGALGNVVDRIRQGAVIDFLDFYFGSYHWPAFNVADSAICVGVAILFVCNFLDARKDKKQEL